ncbi:MAG: extracellular solute-binding protein [Oscillospiraceae bacterium]|nr:extracellular solute-binding protein [Oscillospiraceae bacterium]
MTKKLLAILLALSLLLALAACGGSAPAASEPASSAASEADAAVDAEEPEDVEVEEEEPEEADAAEVEASEVEEVPEVVEPTNAFYSEHIGPVDYELPMFDGDFELSIFWVQLGAMGGAEQPLKQDLTFWQRVQENLGLTLNFKQASEAVCNEQYNLMIASGDMTDLIYESNCGAMGASSVYNGGYDKAIEDDVYTDLTEIIPEYAPNYYDILQKDDNVRKDLTTDTGKLYSIAMIYDQPQGVREGPLCRSDYLADTGLPTPVTTEDWMEAFAAMKANGVQYPMGVSNGGDIRGGFFCNAFGTSGGHAFKVELATGKLVYDGTSDELRDFVTYFAEAFKAGYIDPDYAYAQMFDTSLQTSGAVALFGGMDRDLSSMKESYGLDLMAVPMTYPEGSEAPKEYSYEYAKQRVSGMKNIVVTTACEEPEMAVQFLDWFYSTDGASAVNFGFNEGESYEVVDGVKQWLPFMGDRDENLVNYEVIYALDEGPGFQIVNKKNPITADYILEAKKIWLDVDTSKALYSATPTLAFTAEEAEDMAQVNSDIYTYVATEISRFMMGEAEITDENWNAYVKTVEEMGLAELQTFYDAAYARYADR